tara:strand:+ start:93 stop:1517 length:1425 start_codon:yes stop_codon:yes gene_type:complete
MIEEEFLTEPLGIKGMPTATVLPSAVLMRVWGGRPLLPMWPNLSALYTGLWGVLIFTGMLYSAYDFLNNGIEFVKTGCTGIFVELQAIGLWLWLAWMGRQECESCTVYVWRTLLRSTFWFDVAFMICWVTLYGIFAASFYPGYVNEKHEGDDRFGSPFFTLVVNVHAYSTVARFGAIGVASQACSVSMMELATAFRTLKATAQRHSDVRICSRSASVCGTMGSMVTSSVSSPDGANPSARASTGFSAGNASPTRGSVSSTSGPLPSTASGISSFAPHLPCTGGAIPSSRSTSSGHQAAATPPHVTELVDELESALLRLRRVERHFGALFIVQNMTTFAAVVAFGWHTFVAPVIDPGSSVTWDKLSGLVTVLCMVFICFGVDLSAAYLTHQTQHCCVAVCELIPNPTTNTHHGAFTQRVTHMLLLRRLGFTVCSVLVDLNPFLLRFGFTMGTVLYVCSVFAAHVNPPAGPSGSHS